MHTFRVRLDDTTDPPVLHIQGEIDLATTDELRAELDRALEDAPTLVVDLEGVTRLPSSASRAPICRETADWVNRRRRAAAVIEPRCATVRKISRSCVSMPLKHARHARHSLVASFAET